MPEAGSCAICPKRTGFNKLLFADVRKDSCTDPQCFRSKIDAHVAKALESKPTLVQISSAWNSREGAPLGRNQYVELEVKKAKTNGTAAKLPAAQKPCDKMAEAIVMDGGKRGQTVKVCADPNCRVHHPNTPSPQQLQRDRQQEGMQHRARRSPQGSPLFQAAAKKIDSSCSEGVVISFASSRCHGHSSSESSQVAHERPKFVIWNCSHCSRVLTFNITDSCGDRGATTNSH